MKALINENGAGTKEIAIGLLVILGVTAFGIQSILNNTNDDDYKKMKIQAEKFVDTVTIHKDMYTNESGIYYLEELENNNQEGKIIITNPKNKKESCNMYESYVDINHPKSVKLICGSYMIEGEYQKKYDVYEIGTWQKERIAGEAAFLYNYSKDGKDVFKKPVIEKELVIRYNQEEGASCVDAEDVKNDASTKGYTVVAEMYYRTKKLVKEL